MYIYNPNKNTKNINYPFIKKENLINHNAIDDYIDNIIFPKKIKYIIGIYLLFNKPINEHDDIFVKEVLKKYIDTGFTNIMKDKHNSYFIMRFNIEYEQLLEEITNIYNRLAENKIGMKCSIIYEDKNMDGYEIYNKLLDYINMIIDTNEIVYSNYYEYKFNEKEKNEKIQQYK